MKNASLPFEKTVCVLFAIIVLICSSCTFKKDKVGMLIASQVFMPDFNYFAEKTKQAGIESIYANANLDDHIQITQAKEMIDQGIKVLVIIAVNTNTAAAIVRMAKENGVKTIAYDRIIANCRLDYFLSFDNIKIGELIAKEAIKLKPNGTYMVLNGDKTDQNAVWVKEGFYNVLNPQIKSGQVKVVYDNFIEDWTPENAVYEFKKYVDLTDQVPEVVLSAYTGMNRDISDYLDKNPEISVPLIGGQDADTKERREARPANQRICLYKSAKVEAETAAQLAINIIKKQPIKVDKEIPNGNLNVKSIIIPELSVEVR